MKKISLLFLFVSLILISFAADEKRIPSDISEVTVYRTRAQVNRTATAKVQPGNNLLVVSGLSRFILNKSIIVTGEGDGILQSVKHRISYLNTTPKTPRMIRLEDSLELLDLELAAIRDGKFVYGSEETLILENKSLGGEQTGVSAQQLREMADLYRSRLAEIRKELRKLVHNEKETSRLRNAYANELNQIRAQRDQPTQEVVVAYKANKSGTVKLNVFYMVNNATWNPFYDVRVDKITEPVDFYLKANVVNNSGIDWEDVKLKLSTANNQGDINSPVLYPWFVDIATYGYGNGYNQNRAMQKLAPTANTMVLSDTRGMDSIRMDFQTMNEYTTYAENSLSIEFDIAIPYDIPANGKEHQVDILKSEVPASYRHFAVPKLDKDAFLVAYVKTDLLRGPGNVYFEGTFVGETYINTDLPEDSMKISLGRDPKVLLKRERVEDFTSKKTIGPNIKESFGFEITVKNNKKESVNIKLEDQIPVSRNKEIKVDVIDEGGASLNKETGKLSWNLDLKPGETRKLRFSFEVKYPKDKNISGL